MFPHRDDRGIITHLHPSRSRPVIFHYSTLGVGEGGPTTTVAEGSRATTTALLASGPLHWVSYGQGQSMLTLPILEHAWQLSDITQTYDEASQEVIWQPRTNDSQVPRDKPLEQRSQYSCTPCPLMWYGHTHLIRPPYSVSIYQQLQQRLWPGVPSRNKLPHGPALPFSDGRGRPLESGVRICTIPGCHLRGLLHERE